MSFARSASRSSGDIDRGRSGFDLAQRMMAQVASAVATMSSRDWITEAPSGLYRHRTVRLKKPVAVVPNCVVSSEGPPAEGQEHCCGAQPGSPDKQLGRELTLSRVRSDAPVDSLHEGTTDQLDPCNNRHQQQGRRQNPQNVASLNHCKHT